VVARARRYVTARIPIPVEFLLQWDDEASERFFARHLLKGADTSTSGG
jgi:hypothetical protein